MPKSYKTIEPPHGRSSHKLHNKFSTNPDWSPDEPPGEDSNPTSPTGMKNWTPPPKRNDVNQEDFDDSHTMELHYDGRYNVHAGQFGLHTHGCILVGTKYVEIGMRIADAKKGTLQPGTEARKTYVVPGFAWDEVDPGFRARS